jgi:signal transduction histidine kinase
LVSALVCVALAGLGLRSSQKWGEAESALTSAHALVREGTSQIALERRDERRTLAAELHDEVLPAMFKVHLMGEVIRRDLEAGRLLELEEDVLGLLGATGQAQEAVRQVVGGLRGSSVGARGLSASVRSLCDRLSLEGPSLQVEISEVDLGDRAQTVAYQVVREAVTNAAKYSRASEVRVAVWQEASRRLRVTVSDDGCGFDVDEGLARPDHFGLALMRERVMAVGGELQIESRFGAGTLIWATIPDA